MPIDSRKKDCGDGPDAGPRGLLKGIIYSSVIAAAALVIMLACLEIGLRATGWRRSFVVHERLEPGTPRRLDVRTLHAGTVIRYATKEFDVTYRSNSWGYFDREWKVQKGPETLRIAFFGDSFTMGHGVDGDRAFPRLIEGPLRARLSRPVETMNFGIWGSGTLDEREYIADALAFEPDQVIICFYINDMFDNVRYVNEKERGEDFESTEEMAAELASRRQKILLGIKDFFNARSRAFAFVSERSKNLRDALGLVTYPLEGVFTGQCNEMLKEAAGYLNAIADELAARGIPVTVVYLPAKVQVSTKRAPGKFDLELPNRLLAANLDGPVMIDLTGDFRGVDADELWFREGHYNERGHEAVAAWLAEKLPVTDE